MPQYRRNVALLAAAAAILPFTLNPAAAASAPAAPAPCTAVKVNGGYRISWSAPHSDGGSAVTRFLVRERGYGASAVKAASSARSARWTVALRRTTAEFAVRPVNAAGVGKACFAKVAAPAPEPDTTRQPVADSGLLPYSANSFFKSRVATAPVDAARTASFRSFMATHPEQKSTPYPKINLNPNWAMSYHVGKSSDPIWRLAGGNTADPRLRVLQTQGFHMADSVADTFPTGTQDRPGVMIDPVFGYTVQFADAVPNKATRTITVSNAGVMWHSSNGLDYRNPRSNDPRNFTSRGRIVDSMVIRRDALDRAVANGTGLGHVLHLFFVETLSTDGVVHPMTGAEGAKYGWGAEGERIRLKPSIDLQARGLSGGALAIARTLQENGAYLGDNSGSTTQIKASQPHNYTGTNLTTDAFKGKITWDDFEVVQKGWQ